VRQCVNPPAAPRYRLALDHSDKTFRSGAFAGHICTDGVSLHILRQTRRREGEGEAPPPPDGASDLDIIKARLQSLPAPPAPGFAAALRALGAATRPPLGAWDLDGTPARVQGMRVFNRHPNLFRALEAALHGALYPGPHLPLQADSVPALSKVESLLAACDVRICAVDPGQTDWMSAFSFSPFQRRNYIPPGGNKSELRRWLSPRVFVESTAGFRDATGQVAAARKAEQCLRRADPADRARAIHNITTGRTASLAAFALHCRRKLAGFDAGRRLYGSKGARHARLRKHILRNRHFHRLVQMLAWGATSVTGRWWDPTRRRRRAVRKKPAVSIIGWGAASVGAGGPISRKGLGPSRDFERFVRSHYPTVLFAKVDEYCTSKVCTACWKKTHVNFTAGGRPTHKLQVCPDHAPPLVVDRDVSATRS
jgi:hypothetical protein